jgi:membrane associated rhomboid family serine protease
MGIEDRGYYRDEGAQGGYGGGFYSPSAGSPMQTMVVKIIVINVVLYVADMLSNGWLFNLLALQSTSAAKPWMWWQLLTYGFAHASITEPGGIFHILFNMFILFMFGRPVEERLGPTEFLRVYLIGVVIGGLAFWAVAFTPLGGAACVGASAAVTTIMVLFCLQNPKAQILLFFVFPAPAWVLLVIFLVIDLVGFGRDNVAHEAHLAGGLWGALYFYFGWNLAWLGFDTSKMKAAFKRKPNLKLHAEDDAYDDQDAEADRILQKLADYGEGSLTKKERKILESYSRRMRQKHG